MEVEPELIAVHIGNSGALDHHTVTILVHQSLKEGKKALGKGRASL